MGWLLASRGQRSGSSPHAPGQAGRSSGIRQAVAAAAQSFVDGLTAADLDRVVDEHWDPPVTLGVRLVSVVAEVNQHVGQAAYVKGLLERR